MTTTARRAGFDSAARAPAVENTLVAFVTLRAHLLAFSVPYLWHWTHGLAGISRIAIVVAHSTALLAVGAASTAIDLRRGVLPRLGLVRGSRYYRLDLVPTCAQVLTLVAVAALASVAASPVPWPVTASLALLLAGGWLWARLPTSVKYLGAPEWGGAALAFVLPAAVLAVATPASPSPASVLAAVAFLVAIVFATMLRDRADDLAADIPTAATRRPSETAGWVWLAAGGGWLAVLTGLYTPLSLAEWLAVLGAFGFLGAAAFREWRVPLLVTAHAVLGLYWVFG